jgi:hypothetical protein
LNSLLQIGQMYSLSVGTLLKFESSYNETFNFGPLKTVDLVIVPNFNWSVTLLAYPSRNLVGWNKLVRKVLVLQLKARTTNCNFQNN